MRIATILGLTLGVLAVGNSQNRVQAADALPAGEAGAARMEVARAEVMNVRSNVFITLVDLNEARGQPGAAQPQFQAFTNQLARMGTLARAFGKRADEMKEKGPRYFAEWEAQTASIKDPAVRQRAEQRYDERKQSYDTINRCMQDARGNFMQFVQDLTGMQEILGRGGDDKTTTARDLFMRANWRCIDVQRSLMQIEDELDRLADSFRKDQ